MTIQGPPARHAEFELGAGSLFAAVIMLPITIVLGIIFIYMGFIA